MPTALIVLIVLAASLMGLFLVWQSVVRYFNLTSKESGILESTSKEAKEILDSVNNFKGSAEEKLNAMLDSAVSQYTKTFESSLLSARDKLVEEINQAGKKSQTQLIDMLEEESKEFQVFLDRSQANFTKFFRQEMEQVNQDLKIYKKDRMNNLDAQIKEEVDRLALKVFGKSLTDSDHQQLISKSLENAKKDLKL